MLWRKVSAGFDRFLDILSGLVMVIMVVQMLGIVAHVILRYVFRSPWQGTMAWAQISLVWILFLGSAWVLREEKHITLEMVVGNFNRRTRALIDTITSVMALIAMLIVTWYGTGFVLRSYREGIYMLEYYEIMQAPVYAIVPIGSLFLLLQFLRRTCQNWAIWRQMPMEISKGDIPVAPGQEGVQ